MKHQHRTSFILPLTTPGKARFLGNLTVHIMAYDYGSAVDEEARYGCDVEGVTFEDKDGQSYGQLKALFDLLEDAGCLDIMDAINTAAVANVQYFYENRDNAVQAHVDSTVDMPRFSETIS